MRIILLLAAISLTTSCNKAPDDVVPAAPATSVAPDATAISSAVSPPPEADSIMTITPLKTDNCRPGGYTAELAWSLPSSRTTTGIEVRVNKPDGGLMAYKQARRANATTGNWVTPGTKFFLIDRQTGEIVTEATAGEYDCR